MFTGIIEEIGLIEGIKKGEKSSKLVIKANIVLNDIHIGDSISTNGVCLNLGKLNIGSKVNLERALSIQSRLGGHIVSGHIDGTGKIISFVKEDNAIWVTVDASMDILKYVVHKGSITIDGISLTVAYVDDSCFKVSIIPHTASETTLISKKIGDTVNLECDLIGKYVEKLLGLEGNKKDDSKCSLNEEFLRSNGFL